MWVHWKDWEGMRSSSCALCTTSFEEPASAAKEGWIANWCSETVFFLLLKYSIYVVILPKYRICILFLPKFRSFHPTCTMIIHFLEKALFGGMRLKVGCFEQYLYDCNWIVHELAIAQYHDSQSNLGLPIDWVHDLGFQIDCVHVLGLPIDWVHDLGLPIDWVHDLEAESGRPSLSNLPWKGKCSFCRKRQGCKCEHIFDWIRIATAHWYEKQYHSNKR